VDHAGCYVDDDAHANELESCWSLLWQGIEGMYVAVEPFHL
jgi:hypothetical protein